MEYRVKVDEQGNRVWYNEQGQRHRTDGPAIEYADGSCEWWVNGQRHRIDGPAVEWADGYREWWVNDRLHRLDGPAIEYANGYREWWVNGEWLSEQQFLVHTDKLKAKTCEGRVIEIDGKKYRLTAM